MPKNPLRGYKINVSKLLTPALTKKVGVAAIGIIKRRIQDAKDISDSDATQYSAHGPIYVPVIAGGKGGGWRKGPEKGVQHHKHSGNYGILRSFSLKQNNAGHVIDGYSRTGRSLKFENYAAFKSYLGRSGKRDLTVTGRMLANISVTEATDKKASIGFTDDDEEKKMAHLDTICQQFGFSPKDEEAIMKEFEVLMDAQIQRVLR